MREKNHYIKSLLSVVPSLGIQAVGIQADILLTAYVLVIARYRVQYGIYFSSLDFSSYFPSEENIEKSKREKYIHIVRVKCDN